MQTVYCCDISSWIFIFERWFLSKLWMKNDTLHDCIKASQNPLSKRNILL